MAWLSTLKGKEKAKDMTVYYALWVESTKSTSVINWFNNQSLILNGNHA